MLLNEPRVLHLVPSLTGGGTERQLTYLAAAQADAGIETHVGYGHGGPNLQRLAGGRIHLHPLASRGNYDPRLMLRISRLVKDVNPSIVQTWLTQMDVLGGAVARLRGIPWVLSERSAPMAYAGGWKNRLRRVLAKGATAIVANSSVGLAYWHDVPAPTKRLIIRNIVPFQAIEAAQPVTSADSDFLREAEEIIVAAGRFELEKNWFVTIEALRLALRARPKAHAVVFGAGTMRDAIVSTVSSLECAPRFHVKGYTPELWGWLKRASVYVSASLFEGSPNIVIEAVACQCPVVVSDIPGHREFLSDSDGEFAPASSPQAIADAIQRKLSERDGSCAVGRATLESIRLWSPATIAAEYANLYLDILTCAATGPSRTR